MALPAFLIPMLIGAGVGAVTNREDPLRGALMGGVLGGLTGGLSAATAPGVAGVGGASQSALTAATAPGAAGGTAVAGQLAGGQVANQALAQSAAGQAAAASPLKNVIAREAARSVAINPAQSLNAQALGALTSGGTMSPAASPGLSTLLPSAERVATASYADKALQVIKDKPLETAQFVGALSPQEQQAAPMVAAPPIVQPQRPIVKSTEERLAESVGDPVYISKPLFSQIEREEEERRLLGVM